MEYAMLFIISFSIFCIFVQGNIEVMFLRKKMLVATGDHSFKGNCWKNVNLRESKKITKRFLPLILFIDNNLE